MPLSWEELAGCAPLDFRLTNERNGAETGDRWRDALSRSKPERALERAKHNGVCFELSLEDCRLNY